MSIKVLTHEFEDLVSSIPPEEKIDKRKRPEPLVFPMSYGGVNIDNFVEYAMINELSIKALRWLSNELSNDRATDIITEIDRLDEEKAKLVKDYRKTLGSRMPQPKMEKLNKPLDLTELPDYAIELEG